MKKALLKDSIKEIKNTYKRFISILLMAFLGVGFFAGIRATSPDMLNTIDAYYKNQNVYDIEIVSTLGLTEEDVNELKNVEGEFDMIFLDAAKGQYKLFYDLVIDKLKVGGVLISDNILYKGMIASDDLVVRRKKTIVKRMRNYLDYICNCDYLSTSLIPIGDGVALSYKDKERGESENA